MAKRNPKTHPRVRGETDPEDNFMPPDRPDVGAASEAPDEGVAEVVDFGGTQTVKLDKDGKGEDKDGAGEPEPVPSQVVRREPAAAPAPPRRQEREDRAAARGRQRADGEGDDDRGYSRRVQQRIKRERALVNRERALREQTQKELADERVARQELADRMLRIERAQKVTASDSDVKALKSQIEALVPQIAAAQEAGETAKALTLQIKLGELQGDLKVMEYDRRLRAENAAIVEENEKKERERRAAEAARRPAATNAERTPEEDAATDDFISANKHWWRRNIAARELAIELDKGILADIKDGDLDFEPYSEEHFEELAQRLHEEYPDLEIHDLNREAYEFDDQQDDNRDRDGGRRGARVQNQRGAQRNGNRPPPGRLGTPRGQQSEVELARQGKVVLTEDDFREMRIFKMDPNNPEHKRAFAKERARTILAQADAAAGGNR